jgi:phospholipid transport system substrate-binding protein
MLVLCTPRSSAALLGGMLMTMFLVAPQRGWAADPPAPPAKPAAGAAAPKGPATAKTPATKAPAAKTAKGPATPPADSSPLAEMKKTNASLKKMLARQSPDWTPEHDSRNSEVRKTIDQFLDFEELAKRALVRHWDGLSVKQRTEFTATLRDLVERNYLKQLHGSPNYDLNFDKESKDGNEASVHAVLETVTSKGKKVSVELEYKMVWKAGHWVVYDVITDEQSLLENYRAEFNKVIDKDGFDALLAKMRKKLNEKEE